MLQKYIDDHLAWIDLKLISSWAPWTSVYDDPIVEGTGLETNNEDPANSGVQNNNNNLPNTGGTNRTGTDDQNRLPPNINDQTGQKKTFTQEELNKFLAEDRRKHKQQTEKLINDLETLKKNKNLSDQERQNLQTRIEELQQQIMTKEQIIEQERKKLQHQHQSEIQRERSEKESWRNRYTEATIQRAITDAAVEHEAFSPEQIVALLHPSTRLVEEVDPDGKGVGIFQPRVRFRDTDAEGKPTVLDLSVSEAVKRMKDLTDRFGNLFKSGVSTGLGATGGVGPGKSFDPRKIGSMEEYRRNRDRILNRNKKPGT